MLPLSAHPAAQLINYLRSSLGELILNCIVYLITVYLTGLYNLIVTKVAIQAELGSPFYQDMQPGCDSMENTPPI